MEHKKTKKELKPMTKEFLVSRGECCGNKCTNCPYYPRHKKGSKKIGQEFPSYPIFKN